MNALHAKEARMHALLLALKVSITMIHPPPACHALLVAIHAVTELMTIVLVVITKLVILRVLLLTMRIVPMVII